MLSQTKCLLVLLACGWLAFHLVAADGLKWKEFMCNDRQLQEINDGIQFLLYMDQYLYFYFKSYVLRIGPPNNGPVITKEQGGDRVSFAYLFTGVGTYISYEELQSRPSLLKLNPDTVTGFIYFGPEMREERSWYNLAVIDEPFDGQDHSNRLRELWTLKVNETQKVLGNIGSRDDLAKKLLHKTKGWLGAVWADEAKWFEIYYQDYSIIFKIFELNLARKETKLIGESIGSVSTPHRMAFYPYEGNLSSSEFVFNLLEVDVGKVWVNYLSFKLSGNHLEHTMIRSPPIALAEFLDCEVGTISTRQLKGAFIYQYPTSGIVRSFVFVNNHYFKTRWDLVKINFKMSLGRSGGMKRVQFENNDRPLSERRSIRYLKNWGSKFYATFNPFQTYELTFKGSGDDEELLASHRPNFKIHKCEGSTLTVADPNGVPFTFCFGLAEYFGLSEREDVFHKQDPRPIWDIFRDTNVRYEEQDIEAIIWYKEYNRVVFMTLDYLLIFDRSLFVAYHGGRGRFIRLQQSGILKNYTRLQNCLFQGCDQGLQSKSEKRQILGISLFKPMLILLLVVGISWLVWFLVKHRPISKEAAKAKAKEKLDQVKALLKKAGLSDEWKQKLGLVKHQADGDAAKKADQTAQKPGDELAKSKSLKSIGSPEKQASPQLADSKA